jgi:hypothetical protein
MYINCFPAFGSHATPMENISLSYPLESYSSRFAILEAKLDANFAKICTVKNNKPD